MKKDKEVNAFLEHHGVNQKKDVKNSDIQKAGEKYVSDLLKKMT